MYYFINDWNLIAEIVQVAEETGEASRAAKADFCEMKTFIRKPAAC